MAAVKDGSGLGLASIPLLFSFFIYLGALVASACEFRNDKWVYDRMCLAYRVCWEALFQVWVLAISFAAFSMVATVVVMLLQGRGHRLRNLISIVLLLPIAAMWLIVIVVGWVPLNINLNAGYNGLPSWGRSGNSWDTTYNSKEAEPKAGIFHYAVAWFQTAVQRVPSNVSPAFDGTVSHGRTALAAVIFCNLAFACAIIMPILIMIQMSRDSSARHSRPLAAKPTKERDGPV